MFLTVYSSGQDQQKRRRCRVLKYGAVQTILARYLVTNDNGRNGLAVETFRRRSQVRARKKVNNIIKYLYYLNIVPLDTLRCLPL